MRYDEDYVAGLKARISELEAKRRKCIVKDCENHTDQGAFTGDLCNPCHAFITEGSGFHSQAYRNAKREWVGLTDEDIEEVISFPWHYIPFARAIEAKLREKNASQEQSELQRLRQVCRNVYEIWAGSEGIPVPETCAEGYLLRLIEQMRDEAKAGLYNIRRNVQ